MNKRTKGLIVFLLLLIIAVVIFLCCTYAKSFDSVNKSNSVYAMNETNTVVIENTIEEVKNNTEENTVEEVVEEEPEDAVEDPETEEIVEEENSELQDDNDEDKAIAIVKKDWGDTDGVAFKVEQINGDGSYVISVRNDDSVALEWYTVYPKTGKFSK